MTLGHALDDVLGEGGGFELSSAGDSKLHVIHRSELHVSYGSYAVVLFDISMLLLETTSMSAQKL